MLDASGMRDCPWPRVKSIRLIEKTLTAETSPVTFIALGSLKTAAEAMEEFRRSPPG